MPGRFRKASERILEVSHGEFSITSSTASLKHEFSENLHYEVPRRHLMGFNMSVQRVVYRLAESSSLGNLLEKQNLRHHPRPTEPVF